MVAVQRNYELFKERVVGACGKDEVEQGVGIAGHNHPPLIEVYILQGVLENSLRVGFTFIIFSRYHLE